MSWFNKKILIVDDDDDISCIIRDCLAREGFTCVTAVDGEEGLRLSYETFPDLILLDFTMPGKNGFEVCRELKKDPRMKDIPICIMSAMSYVRASGEAESIGADDYLSKPFELAALVRKVRAFLRPSIHALAPEPFDGELENL
ncbi:response regulator [bacterium]|nr:response regulator [bacterium]